MTVLDTSSGAARAQTARSGLARVGGARLRRDIQGLRAVAVILVIANHAGLPGLAGGYVGVDVFFVISGYVITQLLLREVDKPLRTGLADFYSRRVRRIAPAATATLVATLLIARLVLGSRLNPNLPDDVRWASVFGANFRLIRTGSNYFVPGIYPSLVTQFWSLAVEEQFYLVFPLVVFIVARAVRPAARLRALSGVVAVGVVLSAGWSIAISGREPTVAYYSPFTRFWELGLGCLLAVVTTGKPLRTVRSERLATTVGIGLLVLALVVINSKSEYPGTLAWLPCGASALLIWSGGRGARTPVSRLLATRPMVYIGDLSYSLYLTHYAWLKLPQQLATPLGGWDWRVVELVGMAVTAVVLHRFVENPIRQSRQLANDRVAVLLLLLVCVAASFAAA